MMLQKCKVSKEKLKRCNHGVAKSTLLDQILCADGTAVGVLVLCTLLIARGKDYWAVNVTYVYNKHIIVPHLIGWIHHAFFMWRQKNVGTIMMHLHIVTISHSFRVLASSKSILVMTLCNRGVQRFGLGQMEIGTQVQRLNGAYDPPAYPSRSQSTAREWLLTCIQGMV